MKETIEPENRCVVCQQPIKSTALFVLDFLQLTFCKRLGAFCDNRSLG